MLHRHLNHSEWTLAAIDDVIARGKLDDWKELRDAAKTRTEIRDKILRVATPHLSDPYAQRYHFWNFYVRTKLTGVAIGPITTSPANALDRDARPSLK